jgi:hypothetical protein
MRAHSKNACHPEASEQRATIPHTIKCEPCHAANTPCDNETGFPCTACEDSGIQCILRVCRHRSSKIANCLPRRDYVHEEDEGRGVVVNYATSRKRKALGDAGGR